VGAVITGVNVEGKITAEHHQQQEEWQVGSFRTCMKSPRKGTKLKRERGGGRENL
jgi:hypothetical protein